MVSIEIKVREIIRLDRAYQIECEADANAAFVDEPDSAKQALWSYVHDLTPSERSKVIAVMWIGRGDVNGTWEQLVRSAKGLDSDYLLSKAPLAMYLEQGLNKRAGWKINEISSMPASEQDSRHLYSALLRARYLDDDGIEKVLEEEVQVLAEDEYDASEQFRVYPKLKPSQEEWDISNIEYLEE